MCVCVCVCTSFVFFGMCVFRFTAGGNRSARHGEYVRDVDVCFSSCGGPSHRHRHCHVRRLDTKIIRQKILMTTVLVHVPPLPFVDRDL